MWRHNSVKLLIRENNNSNPLEIIRLKTRELVLDAYSKGWEGPPFSLIKLGEIMNLEIMPNSEIIDARIIPMGDSQRIEYNPNQRKTRINFSIAHEIAHTFFTDCNDTIRNREEKIEKNFNELEYLCDIAASELLLPYAAFTKDANSIPLNLNNLLELSNKYEASLTSVFLRFSEVVNKSCAILVCVIKENGDLICEYAKKSKLSPLELPENFIIPKDSSAYECLNPGWTAFRREKWDIMTDCHYEAYSIGLAPVRKTSTKRVGIFLVPDYYDDKPTDQIYTVFGDATEPRGEGTKIIGQVVNTYGGLGSGFGLVMKKKWPITQKSIANWKSNKEDFALGETKLIELEDNLFAFQMIAQKGLFPTKNNPIPLDYVALRQCLIKLSNISTDLNASVHLPLIGAGNARGSWDIIEGIIYDELILKGLSTTIYILPGSKSIAPKNSSLTQFKEKSLYDSK